jgi:hypothetical protein
MWRNLCGEEALLGPTVGLDEEEEAGGIIGADDIALVAGHVDLDGIETRDIE